MKWLLSFLHFPAADRRISCRRHISYILVFFTLLFRYLYHGVSTKDTLRMTNIASESYKKRDENMLMEKKKLTRDKGRVIEAIL